MQSFTCAFKTRNKTNIDRKIFFYSGVNRPLNQQALVLLLQIKHNQTDQQEH